MSKTDNVLDDRLDRWTAPLILRHLVSVPVLLSSSSLEFDWRTTKDLAALERIHEKHHKECLALNEFGLFVYNSRAIWILNEAAGLQLRLCIIAVGIQIAGEQLKH